MNRSTTLGIAAALVLWQASMPSSAQQAAENHLDALPRLASSVTTITPIFGQLLVFSMPKEFRSVSDATKGGKYLQQLAPIGQDLNRWTELITVTGEEGAGDRPGITARKLAEVVAGFYRQACPESFAFASFGPVKVDTYDGFATIVSCGNAEPARPRSETLMLVTIKGDHDLYTLRWTETGPASKTALPIDAPKWQDRLTRIGPVRLCAIVPGEALPYPSCTLGKR